MITSSIVLFNNSIPECLSILDCLLASPMDKIYLVDHSGNDRLSVLKDYSEKIEYIPHRNLGYGAGHNVAIRKAFEINPDGYHIILNSDILFSPDAIRVLSEFMDSRPNVGLCMPDIFSPRGNRQYLCKYLPTPFDLFGKRFLPSKLKTSRLERLQMKKADYSKVLSVPWIPGCFLFTRVKALKDINGFDERFFMYGEDIDFSRRIHEKYATLYCPDAKVTHAHAAASYHSWRMLMVHIVNVARYFNKWGWFHDPERIKINKKAAEENNLKW